MSNQIRKRTNSKTITKERSITESFLLLFPLLLTVIILPLIVKMHSYSTPLNQYDWFSRASTYFDFFLYYKQWFFVVLCALMVLVIIGRMIVLKEKIKYSRDLLPLFIYALLSLISTIFSKYRSIGFAGNFEQFENIFCLIGYVLVIYYAYIVISSETELKLLINAVAIGALIIGVLGTFQAFGMDFFNTPFGKSTIVEKGFDPNSLGMAFGEGRVYASLYNPNYVGVYTSIMIPLFAVMLFFSKKIFEFILYGAVVITSAISMFGSQSKAGIISIGVAFLVVLVMLRKTIITKWKIFIPIATVLVGSFFVINILNNNVYIDAIIYAFTPPSKQVVNLEEINTNVEHVQVTYKGNTVYFSENTAGDIIVQDSSGTLVPCQIVQQQEEGYLLQIEDARFYEIYIINHTIDPSLDFSLFIDNAYWSFSKTAVPGSYTYYNRYGNFSPIKTAESSIFTGYETFASNRGYIWSRTIPLLKNYLILGAGADTFINVFPQYDYVGYYNHQYADTIISKPHNLYLQVGIQSGVLSLILLITYFVIYIIKSFKIYYKNAYNTLSSIIGLAVFISVISFLVSGITNDSSISVSPVFWVIAGIGFVSNEFNRKCLKL